MSSAYTVAYDAARAQYCVERADGLRVFPMPQVRDPDAGKRARVLAETLNRMEERERIPGPHCACGNTLDHCEATRAYKHCGADVARDLREGEV